MPNASRKIPVTFFSNYTAEPNKLLSFSFSLSIVLLLVATAYGNIRLNYGIEIDLWSKFTAIAGILIFLFSLLATIIYKCRVALNPTIFSLALFLLIFCDCFSSAYALGSNPGVRAVILLLILITWLFSNKINEYVWSFIGLASIVLVLVSFFVEANGRLLFSDDHPTFLFRLYSLRETFPNIPFYNTLWNGGFDARDFFATGALNAFTLLLPFVYLGDLWLNYNYLVATLLFILVPLSLYLACRILTLKAPAPQIAAILSLLCSLFWYRWALKYGTIGFITSASLLPLNISLIWSIIKKTAPRSYYFFAFVSLSLMLCWTPIGVTLLPAILIALFSIKQILKNKKALILAACLICFNLPWVLLFLKVSKVSQFVSTERDSYSSLYSQNKVEALPQNYKFAWSDDLEIFQDWAVTVNPIILLLTLPGLYLLLKEKKGGGLFIATSIWLLILGSVIAPIKPQLDLDRMLLVLSILSVVATSFCVVNLISHNDEKLKRFAAAVALAFVFCTPLLAASIVRNRTIENYNFARPVVTELIAAINKFGGTGRVLFSGSVMHQLGGKSAIDGGHLAPLVFKVDKPLIASSFMHNIWEYKNIIPDDFLVRGEQGVNEYLDLYNVSSVIAHEEFWREYFETRPEYKKVWQAERFSLYTRSKFPNSYILNGEAQNLIQTLNSIELTPFKDEVVLRFNYLPFLECSNCTLSGFKVGNGIDFIKLSNFKSGERIKINSKIGFLRVAD